MTDALYHSSPEYQCSMMTPCTFTGKVIIERERLGREEDHLLWDRREKVRGRLEKLVEEFLGKEKSDDRHYMKRLLENTDGEVVDTESLLLILGQER